MKDLGKVGVIGRFKPLHNGAAALLESLCEVSSEVVIGIGSSNKYNVRNPFRAEETSEMIDSFLKEKFDNYRITPVPDFAHIPGNENGLAWKEYVVEQFGELDHFVSGNEFVRSLLASNYELIYPVDIVPPERRVLLRASRVRYEMATHQKWEDLIPEKVARYLEDHKLVERFRKEFGLETISSLSEHDYTQKESAAAEKMHAREE